jgi:hypothetical protein
LVRPVPDAHAVFVDISNPVKRHSMGLAIIANEGEGACVIGSKIELSKRQDYHSFLNTVEITYLKVAARKLLVPSNTIQDLMNRDHAKSPGRDQLNQLVLVTCATLTLRSLALESGFYFGSGTAGAEPFCRRYPMR